MEYFLAVDIGASSGRHILGHLEEGRMVTEEIHRFSNGLKNVGGELCWDTEYLFEEIKVGLKKCRDSGKIPVSVGIDTWAVDFVFLDRDDRKIGNAVGYRDRRTDKMDREVSAILSEKELYHRTGIQKQSFNTIYQLMAVKRFHPEVLEKAETLLMIPDYFHFLLTGKKAAEYTNATTTQLVSADTGDWDRELIGMLGYPDKIFQKIIPSGTVLGRMKKEISDEIGFDCDVTVPATHDTGSAVLAVPSEEKNTLYISSGTWSLMGVERKEADCSEKSREKNFTNEGGYQRRFRFLKNIMGLWMIQCLKKEWPKEYSFQRLCELAEKEKIDSVVDCNDAVFLKPDSMVLAVRKACETSGQAVPGTVSELAKVIYSSLAECYAKTAEEIEEFTGYHYRTIHIVGGGANAGYLNQLTANAAHRTVLAGPAEATAVGNLTVQMMARRKWKDLREARKCIRRSFEVRSFEPEEKDKTGKEGIYDNRAEV